MDKMVDTASDNVHEAQNAIGAAVIDIADKFHLSVYDTIAILEVIKVASIQFIHKAD